MSFGIICELFKFINKYGNVMPMEKYQRCLICGNYFVTEKDEVSDCEVCSTCDYKEYLCCAVLGEYIPVVSDNKSVCAKCRAEYFECGSRADN